MSTDYKIISKELHDDQYPCHGYTHQREIVRAFVYNEKNEFAIEHIFGEDIFGKRDYFETPGGGVEKGESLEDALIREIEEEIGCICEIKEYLGVV